MSHQEEHAQNLTHEQLKYKEHTERAGHFIKIDLFRSAREEYKAALQYQPGDELCLRQIDAMNANISRDRKTVLTVVPFVLILILVIALWG
ncbi:MAG: hypothetical protein M0Q38_12855 [Bacteroidales bacterium]|jgi:hypothetical protein|nr:hypothetical protein [Bacteroidales bacterium]